MSDRLNELIEKFRNHAWTEEEKREHAISFVYGNLKLDDCEVTREQIAKAWDELNKGRGEPTPFAVYCLTHGKVYLTHAEYSRQLSLANETWRCPKCGNDAQWDGANYQAAIERGEI